MGHLYRTAWQTKAAPRAKAQITSPVKLRPEPKVQCPEERPDDDLLDVCIYEGREEFLIIWQCG